MIEISRKFEISPFRNLLSKCHLKSLTSFGAIALEIKFYILWTINPAFADLAIQIDIWRFRITFILETSWADSADS